MTKGDIENNLFTTTDALKNAHKAMHEATLASNAAKRALASAEANHTLDGLTGRNADERKADLAIRIETEQRDHHAAEDALAQARLNLTLAELDHQLARNLLRLHTSTEAHS